MDNPNADFCIEIDFKKGSESPARIFRTMSELIEVCSRIDATLVKCIDVNIEPVILLEDIESGSVKTWLRNKLVATNDSYIKSFDWKPIIGKYLVNAKYLIVDFIDGKTQINDVSEIKTLGEKLFSLAEDTDVKKLPAYSPVTNEKIIEHIGDINKALEPLQPADKAKFITPEKETEFNLNFNFSPEKIEELLTDKTLESEMQMILKVKKPDYLGSSMWELRHRKRNVLAKISDVGWIEKFKSRQIDLRPGDALHARVKIRVNYDADGEVVSEDYEIVEILDVKYLPKQSDFLKET